MKVLMYSHDSYGLGHLRRTLALAEAFVERDPLNDVLILTGSTVSGAYRMSKGIDILKLPSAIKLDNGRYESSRMSVSFELLRELRSGLILSAAREFDPDVFVVDKAPLGMKGEVSDTLEFLREERPGTLTVLGLRDVMDDPERVREGWQRNRTLEAIEELYDRIIVYGPREVYDPLPLYGLSPEVLSRTDYVGYVGRTVLCPASELPFPPGYVLVTAGGGGDGLRIVESYLEGLREAEPGFDSIVVTGPLMEDADRRRVEELAAGLRVRVLEFRTDMELLLSGAGAVVAMGGYNTTIELLASGKPAVIVPRVEPRVEQLIRAERLSKLGLVKMIHPDDLGPRVLRSTVEGLLQRGASGDRRPAVDLSGAARVIELVCRDVAEKHTVRLGA
ncbi:MAG: hypothetical protein H0V53_10075 [Rubrobacter sp.]|nr:hypothetical protein [Rubrobacter sp.]